MNSDLEKTTEVTEEGTEKLKEGTKKQLDGTENRPGGTENRVEGSENRPEGSQKLVEGTKKREDGTEKRKEGTKKNLESTDKFVEGTKRSLEGTQKWPEGTDDVKKMQGAKEEVQSTTPNKCGQGQKKDATSGTTSTDKEATPFKLPLKSETWRESGPERNTPRPSGRDRRPQKSQRNKEGNAARTPGQQNNTGSRITHQQPKEMSKTTSCREEQYSRQDTRNSSAARRRQQPWTERRRASAKNSRPPRSEREDDTQPVNHSAQARVGNDPDPQPADTAEQKSGRNGRGGWKSSRQASDSGQPRKVTDDGVAPEKSNHSGKRAASATNTSKPEQRPRSYQKRDARASSSRQLPEHSNVENGRDRLPEKETERKVANVDTQTTRKNATGNRPQPTTPEARETQLYIRIQKVFDDLNEFSSFLTNKINAVGLEVQVAEKEVTYHQGFTYYTLTCPSKSKATKVQQLLNTKSTPRVDCRLHEFKLPKVVGRIQELRKFAVAEAMFEVDERSDELIKSHSYKLRSINREIDRIKLDLKNFYKHDKAASDLETLEQKEVDLKKQKEEFIEARDVLKTKLRSAEDSDDFYKEIRSLRTRFKRDCNRFDKGLPVYAMRRNIVELVEQNQVSVILGDTGSGKSTQLVQYLHETGVGGSGIIVCTQPRRVAAASLATHVADEMMTKVGQEVGYRVGCKMKQSHTTKILYTTDNSLLNECLADPDLKSYSCIIVDEAHERSLYTDLLLSMIKKCLPRRPDLRVIVTSATIDPGVFQEFFGGCPVLQVPGRTFPVEVSWMTQEEEEAVQDNYCESAIQKVMEIHTKEPPGDILVFVTSPAETEQCCQLLQKKMHMRADFRCFQLHGKQQSEEQQKVFVPAERGKRKIVFATNCAETSITIDGINYVVDTGRAKEMSYDPKRNLNSLRVSTISRSSANQRKGRAGRTAPGKCYRLYSEQTYDDMKPATLPEIPRIHLGHALLKLAELGVERDTYDFVQSPSQDTIWNAKEMLNTLGALSEGRITEKGRWIASLPFDPRLGLLTYIGREQNILYDSIVVAAVMSSEAGVFYRGTSEENQRIHDVTKTKFSLDKGDSLTCLAVYKAWLRVPDKEKNSWCMQNGLNAKALRGIKETVNEVCHVLEQDLQTRDFSEEDVTEDLRKMIVRCYSGNLCHYLGRENAGYYVPRSSRRVHFHPSSCLKALASAPEWVVFDQLIQTSRDFITGITPVEESWVAEMDEDVLGFDLEEIRRKTIEKIFSRHVGSRAFFAVVGPSFTKLRELEQAFATSAASVVFIEAVRDTGEISVYSTGKTSDTEKLIEELERVIQEAVAELESEDREEVVAGSMKQGVRAVLGQGGEVQEILLPDQSRKLFIKRPSSDATEESILQKFSKFGQIRFCKQFDEGNHWGFLIFKTAEQAVHAERATSFDSRCVGQVEHRRSIKDETSFRVYLSWPRSGDAFVRVSRNFFKRCLFLKTFHVDTQSVTITADRTKRNRLCLKGITMTMTEDLIRRSLLYALGKDENADGIVLDVIMLRKRLSSEDVESLQQQILDTFRPHLSSPVRVYLDDHGCDDAIHIATVRFTEPMEGYAAYEKVNHSYSANIDDKPVYLKPVAKIKLTVPRKVWDVCKVDVREAIDILARQNVKPYITEDEEDTNLMLIIEAASIEEAVTARTYLDTALQGEVVDCGAAPTLWDPDGAALLKAMAQDTGATVTVNRWSRTITIRGPLESRMKMRDRITQLTEQMLESQEHSLRGEDKPQGLMKALILKYGEDLGSLIRTTGLQSAAVNFRRHMLKVTGSRTSLDNAAAEVLEMTEALWAECSKTRPTDAEETEECSVCLCPIEAGQLYRLELCAHPYCKDCFKHQVYYAVADKAVPILCCHEGCERPLALRDLTNLLRDGHLNRDALTKAAVGAYVLTNKGFRHCPTTDCPAVYRVTPRRGTSWRYSWRPPPTATRPSNESQVFVCPACCTSTCTACGKSAHGSLPCESVDEPKDVADSTVDDWAARDPENRKRCPLCHCGIEKYEGCNKMICKQCRTIFCWVCGQIFTRAGDCEDHLVDKHGGIFPANFPYRQGRRARRH